MIAAGAAVAAASAYLLLRNRREQRTRLAKYACTCGRVEADLIVPTSSYRYLELPSLQCCCDDCMHFCQKVTTARFFIIMQREMPSLPDFYHLVQASLFFYNKAILLKKGKEHVKSMKLTEKGAESADLRHYSFVPAQHVRRRRLDSLPSTLPFPICHPWSVSIMIESTKNPPNETSIVPGAFTPIFISKCLLRLLLLSVLGEKGPGTAFPCVGIVDVGLDSITI